MSYVVINNEIDTPKLFALLDQKKALFEEGQKLEKEAKEIDEKRSKILLKINRLDDKANPIMQKYLTKELGEFETWGKLEPVEGELRIGIIDQVEKFKETYKQVMNERKEK